MIRIRPTTASGLSFLTFSLDLPEGEFDLGRERQESIDISLGNTGIVSTWPKSISGHQVTTDLLITMNQYATLRTIDEHATVTEWIVVTQNRTFQASVTVISALPATKNGVGMKRVKIKFTIISELHR